MNDRRPIKMLICAQKCLLIAAFVFASVALQVFDTFAMPNSPVGTTAPSHSDPASAPPSSAKPPSSTPDRQADKPADKSPDKPPKPPFPLAETATQAESASITLRSIETLLGNDRDINRIQLETPILSSEIDNRLDETARLLSSAPSLQVLGEQEQDWAAIQKNLDEWKKSLQRRQEQLKAASDQIKTLDSTWDQEQKLGVDYWFQHSNTPELLETAQQAVIDTQSLINQTGDELKGSWVELFGIQQSVDRQAARVLGVLDSVRRARDEAFNRLFSRNSPALWSMPQAPKENHSLLREGRESLVRQVQAVIAYISRRRDNVGAQIGLMLVLVAGLYWIHHRTKKWAQRDPELDRAICVFSSPIATGIVLSLVVSSWIYPQAPRLLWAIIGAAALVPTVIILRRLIDQRWFTMLSALVIFYFLDQVRSISAVVPLIARLVLLFEMTGGAVLLVMHIRSVRHTPAASGIAKVIRLITWIWLAVFVLALVGDILGYVSLANLLGDAALQSAYLAVIIYAAALILSGLFVLTLRSRPISLLTMMQQHQQLILRRLNVMLAWLAVAGWLLSVLGMLSLASAAIELTKKILAAEFSYGQLHLSLGHLLAFPFTLWASVQISRFIRFVLEEDVYDRFPLAGGIPYAISKMLNYVILLIGFFLAVSALGYDLTTFSILAGAFTVSIGFGMQNIFNNFVSGLILLFERPVKVGDVIQMDDTTGVVGHIGIRASIIRTLNSAEIIVPNGNLISGKVTNWTLSNRQRGIEINVAAGATANPIDVINLLTKVAAEHKLITKSPPPEVFLMSFNADSFSYQLHAWTNTADQWVKIRSDLSVAIHAALVQANIPIR